MTQVAVKLPDDLKTFVEQSVKSGAFQDADDFMVNLLYSIKAQSESGLSDEHQAKLANLRTEIAIGIAQAEAGDFTKFTDEEIIVEPGNPPRTPTSGQRSRCALKLLYEDSRTYPTGNQNAAHR